MKKILIRSLVFVSLASWTLFSLASGGSHPENCRSEWRAALMNSSNKTVEESFEPGVNKETSTIETSLPGALLHFINQ
jgi:hypothetical protein